MKIIDILTEDRAVTSSDLKKLEYYADKVFANVGIDVEFTRHFLDRVNDERNDRQITLPELAVLFRDEYAKWGKKIAQLGPDAEGVMKDMRSDINVPFALTWDSANQELDLIAKTVMRKKNFRTPNQEFPVESQLTEDLPLADLVAIATVANVSVPVIKTMIKTAYRTGKGLLQLQKLASQAGVKLSNRLK